MFKTNAKDATLTQFATRQILFGTNIGDSTVERPGDGQDDQEVMLRFRAGRALHLLHNVQTGSGPIQPPTQWVNGALSKGL